jgi:drug/metabolite transporter (DMT)-like permease
LAVGETSVAIVLICLATSPVFAAVFSKILLKETIFSITWVTTLICFIGVGIAGVISGLIALLVVDTDLLFEGNIFLISVTGVLILPISFAAINIATRYTPAPNISLLMLLEKIIGPFWVWVGVGEKISFQMMIGGLIVIISLAFYIFLLSKKSL